MDISRLLQTADRTRQGEYEAPISERLQNDFKSIAPGTFHALTLNDGQEFVVLRAEDLDIILARARMRRRDF